MNQFFLHWNTIIENISYSFQVGIHRPSCKSDLEISRKQINNVTVTSAGYDCGILL
jgi:hypothetical protein